MRAEIHPDYHRVIFLDTSTGREYQTRSTMTSEEVRQEDGEDIYVIRMDVTADSHPYFTGEQRIVDTAGRVERFRRRYQRGGGAAEATAATEEADASAAAEDAADA